METDVYKSLWLKCIIDVRKHIKSQQDKSTWHLVYILRQFDCGHNKSPVVVWSVNGLSFNGLSTNRLSTIWLEIDISQHFFFSESSFRMSFLRNPVESANFIWLWILAYFVLLTHLHSNCTVSPLVLLDHQY